MSFQLAEIERRLTTLAQIGQVEQADYQGARLKMRIGDLLTGWMPWADLRAGGNVSWHAPEIGEQMLVIAPGGDISQAVAIGGIYTAQAPAPAASATVEQRNYGDGSFVRFDRATGNMTISVTGDLHLIAQGNVQIQGQRVDLN